MSILDIQALNAGGNLPLTGYRNSGTGGITGVQSAPSFSDTLDLAMQFRSAGENSLPVSQSKGTKADDDGKSGDGCLAVNGKVVNFEEGLQAIAREDFGKFITLLGKLQSGDPDSMLDALAEIAGVSRQELQQAISEEADKSGGFTLAFGITVNADGTLNAQDNRADAASDRQGFDALIAGLGG